MMKDGRKSNKQLISEMADLRQRLSELEASEARFKMIYEYAPVMMDAFDDNGRCILWNNECHKVFGWTMEEINAHDNPLALFYPDPEIRKQVLDTITSKPEKVFREWHPLAKDGSELVTSWANFKLPDNIVINLGYDITELKRAEEELEKHREHLEDLVEERTKELRSMVNTMAGREIRMAELKDVIKQLREQLEKAGITPVANDALAGAEMEPEGD